MHGTQNKPKIQPGSIKGRLLLLLLSLLLVIIVHPLFEGRPALLNLLLLAVLIVALYVVSARDRWWFITFGLGIPPLATLLLSAVGVDSVFILARALVVLFYAYTIFVLLVQEPRPGRLWAIRCSGRSYLLLGVAWTVVYGLVECFQNGWYITGDNARRC